MFIIVLYLSNLALTKNIYTDYEKGNISVIDDGGLPDSGVGPHTIEFWFNINLEEKYVNDAKLVLQVDDINYPDELDTITFIEPDGTAHNLGLLKTSTNSKTIVYISINPRWIKTGINMVRVEIGSGWTAFIEDSTMEIKYTIWENIE